MLLKTLRFNRRLLQVADGLLSALAVTVAFVTRNYVFPSVEFLAFDRIHDFIWYLPFLVLSMLLCPFVLHRRGFYQLVTTQGKASVFFAALETSIILFLIHVSILFFLKLDLSRLVFLFFIPINALFIYVRETQYAAFRKKMRLQDGQHISVILVLDEGMGSNWGEYFAQNPQLGFRISAQHLFEKLPLQEFVGSVHEQTAGIVIFDLKASSLKRAEEFVQACESEGVEVWLAADFLDTRLTDVQVDHFHDKPIMVFRNTPDDSMQLAVKEVLDRTLALIGVIILMPLLLVIAIVVKFSSKGRVIYSQRRSGRFGKPFTMYKFRTMVTDAEQRLIELKEMNEMEGPAFKLSQDPRVTGVGRFLRMTSMDELPQLFNVLRGEMSLVGPRPLPVYETDAIKTNSQRRRLSVKPGLTCLWQIRGRNEVRNFEDWVRLDLEYIDKWSLWLDLKILVMTVPVVLLCRGAK